MTLYLDERGAAIIEQHADSELPNECCGVLLGYRAGQAASEKFRLLYSEPRASARADFPVPCRALRVEDRHTKKEPARGHGNREVVFSHRDEAEIVITRVIPARNIAAVDRGRSYQVGWDALLEAHRCARQGSGEVVGFYHSHPDGSVTPSEPDTDRAWPGYVYVIVSAARLSHTAWRVCRRGAPFRPVPIVFDPHSHSLVRCAS